ncbi:nitrite transporter NirC [Salmonella enterica subsp. enterica]|uniref:Nitrite transporter NirC n=1 Tax=Salmonella enterica I TaxID=59201 RepID=A0A447TTX2_SALET|nr:nitrite transporter NirC [Salmonella enterica subsp. enterica]
MFTDTINKCAANAARIARLSANNPLGFWVSSAMAGAYVGLGIILIFTLGNLLDPSVRPLVMGATFGIALTLVIIAGSELFTGHTMFLTLGVKAGTISHGQMWAILPQTWLGNLVGSVFVALLLQLGRRQFIAGRYQHRSLSRAGRKPPRPPRYCSSKARCVTGWFVWQSGWQSAPKARQNFLLSGGVCWRLSLPATSTPSRI